LATNDSYSDVNKAKAKDWLDFMANEIGLAEHNLLNTCANISFTNV